MRVHISSFHGSAARNYTKSRWLQQITNPFGQVLCNKLSPTPWNQNSNLQLPRSTDKHTQTYIYTYMYIYIYNSQRSREYQADREGARMDMIKKLRSRRRIRKRESRSQKASPSEDKVGIILRPTIPYLWLPSVSILPHLMLSNYTFATIVFFPFFYLSISLWLLTINYSTLWVESSLIASYCFIWG